MEQIARTGEINGKRLKQIEYLLATHGHHQTDPTSSHMPESAAEPRSRIGRFLHACKRIPASIPVLASFLSFVLGVFGAVAAYTGLRYDVSVDPYTSNNPLNPFKTQFVISNQGPFSIYDVRFFCAFARIATDNQKLDYAFSINTKGKPEIRAHDKLSFYCAGPDGYDGQLVKEGVLVDIFVFYKPRFLPWVKRGGSEYLLNRDTQNNVHWVPTGAAAETPEEFEKRAHSNY